MHDGQAFKWRMSIDDCQHTGMHRERSYLGIDQSSDKKRAEGSGVLITDQIEIPYIWDLLEAPHFESWSWKREFFWPGTGVPSGCRHDLLPRLFPLSLVQNTKRDDPCPYNTLLRAARSLSRPLPTKAVALVF